MTLLTSIAVLLAPVVLVIFTILRASALFSSVRRHFDGGEESVRPIMDRVAISRGSRSVSLILDLEDLSDEESSVAFVRRFLAQRYRNLELLVLCGSRGIPTELGLAFDLNEVGTAGNATIHRSRRDERVVCVVRVSDDGDFKTRWQDAVGAASGDLVFPLDGRWVLSPNAVAELAAPWVRTPNISAAFAVINPRTRGRLATTDLVSTRTDLVAIAGLGSGASIQSALGALGSGNEGCIAAMFKRGTLQRLGGLPGRVSDPSTWTALGHQLQVDALTRRAKNDVQVLSKPLGSVASTGRLRLGSIPAGSITSPRARTTQLVLAASEKMIFIVAFSVLAAVVGRLMGTVSANVLWIAATAPLLSLTVVVLGLMMDDRALSPVGRTSARLSLLVGGFGAGLWGTIGSPLRRPPGELHRA